MWVFYAGQQQIAPQEPRKAASVATLGQNHGLNRPFRRAKKFLSLRSGVLAESKPQCVFLSSFRRFGHVFIWEFAV